MMWLVSWWIDGVSRDCQWMESDSIRQWCRYLPYDSRAKLLSVKRRARDDIGRRQSTNKICSKDKTRIGFFDTRKKHKKRGRFGRVLQEKAACIDRSIDVKKGKWRRVMEGKGDQ